MFSSVFRCFPVLALIVTVVNAIIIRQRSQNLIQQNPELERGYRRLFWGLIFFINIPWVTMTIGIFVGDVPTVWHFFDVLSGNLYVIIFWGILIALWIIGFVWICFLGGAEFLIEYYWPTMPERTRSRTLVRTPLGLKISYALGLIGGAGGLLFGLVVSKLGILDMLAGFP
jgi:hypothetical protein